MFRPMRRSKQLLPEKEALEIIEQSNTCTLALMGDEGYPYSLPITYVYCNGKFYMHGAEEGHKIDAIKNCSKVSLSIIAHDEIIEEKYTNKFKSVIVFGKARILDDQAEIYNACRALAEKTCPSAIEGIEAEIQKDIHHTGVIEITPEHISGKEGMEFFRLRK